MYGYGIIGNCHASALVSSTGNIDWWCVPRPDSPPVFGRLLDPEGGHFGVDLDNFIKSEQSYVANTNVLETILESRDGSRVKITDFCPRFSQYGRTYRPQTIIRIVEPLGGKPRVRITIKPIDGWSKEPLTAERGNSHLRFQPASKADMIRLTTNMPLTYAIDATSFALGETLYFALTHGGGFSDDLAVGCQQFLQQTLNYWRTWVAHCNIPTHYQEQTIRSALALKLHCFEDTGAILAALTTSLPEEVGGERNWDYRFCWPRDSYYALSAFHKLGHFEEMEAFVKFLLNVADQIDPARENPGRLYPVYRLDGSLPNNETVHENWKGYGESKPVRSDNQAAEHEQNDVYGEMVLTLAPIFFDARFMHLRTPENERLLERLVFTCKHYLNRADAGLWEFRNGWREHSFSNLMCWAGLDRGLSLQKMGYLKGLGSKIEGASNAAFDAVMRGAVDGSVRNGPEDKSFDASLIQLPLLRFPDAEASKKTVLAAWENLRYANEGAGKSFLYRYVRTDDFGRPRHPFLICSFWLCQGLARIGMLDEAKQVLEDMMQAKNHLGLFGEHYDPETKQQTGNFPQAYSHVGQLLSAFAVSPPWEDVL